MKSYGEKLSQGWPPFQARYGYASIGDKKHKTWAPFELEALWIRRTYTLFGSEEYSLKRLEKILHDEGMRTRGGAKVGKSTLNRILIDQVYIGRIPWCGRVYEGRQEPLVSVDLFNKVQAQLKRKDASKYRKHDHLFRGMAYCGGCGKQVSWEIQKEATYGYCKRYGTCTERKGAKQDAAELEILPILDDLIVRSPRIAELLRIKLKERHQADSTVNEATLAELQGRLAQSTQRLSRLFDEKMDGKVNESFYGLKFGEYTAEKETLAKSISDQSQAGSYDIELKGAVYDLSQKGREIYLSADTERKRDLLRKVFVPFVMRDGSLQLELKEEFALLRMVAQSVNNSNSVETEEIITKMFEPEISGFHTKMDDPFEVVHPGWRRGRDSNPGFPCEEQLVSSESLSTTQPPLRM